MEHISSALSLHLHSGIPVVALLGDWNEQTDTHLADTVTRLLGCGHLEIVVNLAQAQRLPHPERGWLDGLERLASAVRTRHGRLDVVGGERLERAGIGSPSSRSFLHWATTEVEAICHIKGVPCLHEGEKLSLRLV
jgi:hypothetical protein